VGPSPAIDLLREKIRRIEAADRRVAGILPFGLEEIDARLPGGGLALGALHEVAGAGNGTLDGAAAALFSAGIMARLQGQILWCVREQDLFAPGLEAAGLSMGRVIYVEAGDELTALACFEEGLRHGGLGGVVAEIGRLSMTSSRRLQLAAESSGTIGIAIRRWRRQRDAADFGQPTASTTRWRVSVLPSEPLAAAAIGRGRWLLELIRCRAGESADFEVEGCDHAGRLALPAELADRTPGDVATRRARSSRF
jgi:protein ImuA